MINRACKSASHIHAHVRSSSRRHGDIGIGSLSGSHKGRDEEEEDGYEHAKQNETKRNETCCSLWSSAVRAPRRTALPNERALGTEASSVARMESRPLPVSQQSRERWVRLGRAACDRWQAHCYSHHDRLARSACALDVMRRPLLKPEGRIGEKEKAPPPLLAPAMTRWDNSHCCFLKSIDGTQGPRRSTLCQWRSRRRG